MTCPPRSRWPSPTCRRAKSPATPTAVREALALLSEAEDFRVRTLTDTEPEATPLGPFAVVDVLKGTAPTLAAVRQGCGYYDVVQELARVHEEKRPPRPPPRRRCPRSRRPPRSAIPAPVPARPERAARSHGETVQARSPRKRTAAGWPLPEADEASEAEAPSFLKRDLPKPRGRFTRLDAPKTSFQELTRATGKETLAAALKPTSTASAAQLPVPAVQRRPGRPDVGGAGRSAAGSRVDGGHADPGAHRHPRRLHRAPRCLGPRRLGARPQPRKPSSSRPRSASPRRSRSCASASAARPSPRATSRRSWICSGARSTWWTWESEAVLGHAPQGAEVLVRRAEA